MQSDIEDGFNYFVEHDFIFMCFVLLILQKVVQVKLLKSHW